ncbi:MAG: endolytic transglycosylase MltG [Bacteroidota bacterium]|jgi:UPF0755 protein
MRNKFAVFLLIFLFLGVAGFFAGYSTLFKDNINEQGTSARLNKERAVIFYIKTGSTYDDVIKSLKRQQILHNIQTFKLVANRVNYAENVRPGRYLLSAGMSNLNIVRKLRSGSQDPVKITFNNIQNKEQLAEKIAEQLEPTKSEILQVLRDKRFLDSLQLTEESFPTIFLANTYEFYWNTSASGFVQRMLEEYHKFWNSSRLKKAEKLGLTPTEVIILASIIQKESNHYDEYPTIAGVYLNRLRIGMPLQADPTVMYALKKLGQSQRVYHKYLKIDSPYNTYINKGLPPGPICLPELKSIEQTLDAEEHKYVYFCAKEDFSGYHAFAETWQQHTENARKYQQALNQRNIR